MKRQVRSDGLEVYEKGTKVKLSDEQRSGIMRELAPRDTTFSLKFSERDLTAWRAFAEKTGESMTELVERAMADILKKGI